MSTIITGKDYINMDQEYFGFYKELDKWRFDKILNIKQEDLSIYEFIVLKTNDYIVPITERHNAINHRYFFQILDTELNRKTITLNNWSLVSKMSTNSAFSPSLLYFHFVDRFGEELIKRVLFSRVNFMKSVLEFFESLEKFYDVSHYQVFKENEKLKKQLQKKEESYEELINENKQYLEQIEDLKKKLKKINKLSN